MIKGQNTISRSSEKNSDPGERYVLSSTCVPVEIFVIFIIHNELRFTINDIMIMMEQMHRIALRFERVQQILNDLHLAGKIKVDIGKSKKNHTANFYSFKKIA